MGSKHKQVSAEQVEAEAYKAGDLEQEAESAEQVEADRQEAGQVGAEVVADATGSIRLAIMEALGAGVSVGEIKRAVTESLGDAGKAAHGNLVRLVPGVKWDALKTPQARGILECLEAAGGEMNRKDLEEQLGGFISTRQSTARIFAYYKGKLVDGGYITIE